MSCGISGSVPHTHEIFSDVVVRDVNNGWRGIPQTGFSLHFPNSERKQMAGSRQILSVLGPISSELDANGNMQYPPLPVLSRATLATIDASYNRAKNYWRTYQNIKRACYNMLDDNIDDAFKVSDDPNLTGWNPSMNIIDMIDNLVTT